MSVSHQLELRVHLPLDRFDVDVDLLLTRHVTAIFGASGSGKTSLLECIAGLRNGVRGRIRLDDHVWLDRDAGVRVPPTGRDIGFVPQEGLLFPHLDVRENLATGARRARMRGFEVEAHTREIVDMLDIGHLLHRRVTTLSGGERQRVSLARALCSGPRLLLLDEPMAAIDAGLRRRVLPFLRKVRDRFEIPILLISHDPLEVQALCDEVVVLRDGKSVAQGDPRVVFADPKVLPGAAGQGLFNFMEGVVARTEDGFSVVLLGGPGGLELITPPAASRVGEKVLLGVPADDLLLARQRLEGVSASNLLPATVAAITPSGALRIVHLTVVPELPPFLATLTERSCLALQLAPGVEVFVAAKASSFKLFEAGVTAE
jgi:molybdate transport system ATP-binding protein